MVALAWMRQSFSVTWNCPPVPAPTMLPLDLDDRSTPSSSRTVVRLDVLDVNSVVGTVPVSAEDVLIQRSLPFAMRINCEALPISTTTLSHRISQEVVPVPPMSMIDDALVLFRSSVQFLRSCRLFCEGLKLMFAVFAPALPARKAMPS